MSYDKKEKTLNKVIIMHIMHFKYTDHFLLNYNGGRGGGSAFAYLQRMGANAKGGIQI